MRYRRSGGFTLLETIVYLALFAVVTVTVMQALSSMSGGFVQLRKARTTTSAAQALFGRLLVEARRAKNVDATQSSFNVTAGSLAFDTGARFTLVGSAVAFYASSSASVGLPLTPPTTQVTQLLFRQSTTTVSTAIKVDAVIDGKRFYTTVVVRGAY